MTPNEGRNSCPGLEVNCVLISFSALGQNPLHCDCNLRWLNTFLQSKLLDNGVARCFTPKSMHLRSVFHSTPENFSCSHIGNLRDSAEALAMTKCLPCAQQPCLHEGRCRARTGIEFDCTCKAPFYGERCEQKMNACFGKPCKHGGICTFLDDMGHYK